MPISQGTLWPLISAAMIGVGGACSSASTQGTGAGGAGSSPTGTSVTPTGPATSTVITGDGGGAVVVYGTPYLGGQFHLGPVDYAETEWHNACAPMTGYTPAIQSKEGLLLGGLWNGIPNTDSYCDACIHVTTDKGKSALLRVVTYGDTAESSIDVSPEAFAILDSGEYPRAMEWQFAKCPDTGPVIYEVQTGSSEWWMSLWVRNARVPLAKVEVKSPNHTSWFELARGSGDGTLNDGGGFGKGSFTLRLTGIDGQTYEDTFPWPAGGIAGVTLTGHGNFQ